MSTTYRELRSAIDALNTAEEDFIRVRQKQCDAHARVGRALRACRKRTGLGLRAVAKTLGVSAPYLSDVELGRRTISTDHLETYMDLVVPLRRMKQ